MKRFLISGISSFVLLGFTGLQVRFLHIFLFIQNKEKSEK